MIFITQKLDDTAKNRQISYSCSTPQKTWNKKIKIKNFFGMYISQNNTYYRISCNYRNKEKVKSVQFFLL